MKKKVSNEEFIQIVKESLSYSEIIKKMGLIPAGGNFLTVKKRIKQLNLDVSHMTGQGWNTGERFKSFHPIQDISEILVENSTYVTTSHLKERLFKEGLKEKRCECCKNTEWMGQPIKLELHHINGIKDDLRIENLQILCPNCHAYTDNYRGRKLKK